jgi:cyclophilin family peptidyl-prolyl cis-trans isomerase
MASISTKYPYDIFQAGTKEDLASFQAKRNRWISTPRPQLIPLPPCSPKIVPPETFGSPITMEFQSPPDVLKVRRMGSSLKGKQSRSSSKPTMGLFGSLSLSAESSGTSHATSLESSSTAFPLPSFGAPSTAYSEAPFPCGQTKVKSDKITAFPPMSFLKSPTPSGQATFPTPESGAFPSPFSNSPMLFGQVQSHAPASVAVPPTPLTATTCLGQTDTINKSFAAAATFPPLSSKTPTPFGQAKTNILAAVFPPQSTKVSRSIGASTERSDDSDYRTRLVEFYKTYNPSKVDTVDETLNKYKGKEEELFQKLQAKYTGGSATVSQSDFPLPSGEGPLCYLKFSVNGQPAGRVVVKLYQDKTPLAADNFKCLCTGEKGMGRLGKPLCYRGSKVHRIVPRFCIQLGDFTKGNGTGGESIYPPNSQHGDAWGRFKDELFMQHSKLGLLSMANSGRNTNSSQVFFTLRPVPYLDGKHVVFGEVVEGIDVVEALGKLEVDSKQNPVHPVVISECGEV